MGKVRLSAERARSTEPSAVAARYDRGRDRLVIELSTGYEVAFPPRRAQGLERAKRSDLAAVEISPSGFGLHFPRLDADLWLPALLGGCSARAGGWRPGSGRAAAKPRAGRRRGRRAPTASSAAARENQDRVGQRAAVERARGAAVNDRSPHGAPRLRSLRELRRVWGPPAGAGGSGRGFPPACGRPSGLRHPQESPAARIRRGPTWASPFTPARGSKAVPVHQGRPCAPGLAFLANSEWRIANGEEEVRGPDSFARCFFTIRYSLLAIRLFRDAGNDEAVRPPRPRKNHIAPVMMREVRTTGDKDARPIGGPGDHGAGGAHHARRSAAECDIKLQSQSAE